MNVCVCVCKTECRYFDWIQSLVKMLTFSHFVPEIRPHKTRKSTLNPKADKTLAQELSSGENRMSISHLVKI